jgi:hypothetical protein
MSLITSPLQKLPDLLLMQYRTSPNFIRYLTCYAAEMQEVYSTFQQCLTDRYYDVAVGAQLDVIGDIVGASRTLSGVVIAGNFGYLYNPESRGMGKLDDPTVGGPFRSIDDDVVQDVKLDDTLFRNWIDARILKCKTACNTEDAITFFKLLLNMPNLNVIITEPAEASVLITLDASLSIYGAALVKSLAQHIKPNGVTFVVQDQNGIIPTLPVSFKR